MKSMHTIHKELGFTEGKHFNRNSAVPGGITYTDNAVIEMYNLIDQVSDPATREYLKQRLEGAKARKAAAADQEKAKREQIERDRRYAEARAAEIQQKENNKLRAIIRRANPLATEEDVERLLPALRDRLMLERSLATATGVPSDFEREQKAKWNAD